MSKFFSKHWKKITWIIFLIILALLSTIIAWISSSRKTVDVYINSYPFQIPSGLSGIDKKADSLETMLDFLIINNMGKKVKDLEIKNLPSKYGVSYYDAEYGRWMGEHSESREIYAGELLPKDTGHYRVWSPSHKDWDIHKIKIAHSEGIATLHFSKLVTERFILVKNLYIIILIVIALFVFIFHLILCRKNRRNADKEILCAGSSSGRQEEMKDW